MSDDNKIESKKWYAMRIPKLEFDYERRISETADLECFVAKITHVRTYHGKKYPKAVPLIPSIIFVYGTMEAIAQFRLANKDIKYLPKFGDPTGKKIITIPTQQMLDFISIAEKHQFGSHLFDPAEVRIEKGTRVKIHGGVFDGTTGCLAHDKSTGKAFVAIILDYGLGSICTAEITPDVIEILE